MKASSLYITYDGLLDPLGSSQIVSYVVGLSARGVRFLVVSFEKPEKLRSAAAATLKSYLAGQGIGWYPLRYHKRPSVLATSYDLLRGFVLAVVLVAVRRVRIVHTRSYVPSVVALPLKRLCGVRFVFDMRGLWADERVDGNWWPQHGRLFRIVKRLERRFLLAADHIVVLTNDLKEELLRFPYLQDTPPTRISVIPTCVALRNSHGALRTDDLRDQPPGDHAGFTYVYVGSVGTLYLLDEMAGFFAVALEREPSSTFLFLVNGSHDLVHRTLRLRQIPMTQYAIMSVPHDQVGRHLVAAQASVFFIKSCYSKIGSYPTKFGESLACGLPVVTNRGCGDVDRLIERERVGVIINECSPGAYRDALGRLAGLLSERDLRTRCQRVAAEHLSLERGVRAYARVYDGLSGGVGAG